MKASSLLLTRAMITLACAMIILMPAVINGYPFVYADTGTYIRSAFEDYVPFDRPYWYGPFVRATSLGGATLWGAVIAQALVCASYMVRVSFLLLPAAIAGRAVLAACMLLSISTGLGWYAGQLLPDIFTGVGLLAIYLLLRGDDAPWLKGLDALVIGLLCWTHLSNLLILPLAGALLLIIGLSSASSTMRQRALWLGASIILGWGGLALANRALSGEAYISRSSHVFFMGRMLDTGMLRPYLEEHCPTEHFFICAYMDSLPPHSQAFLWWESSPPARQGGWEATREEYGRIVRGSVSEPRYLWWHIRGSLASTWQQLISWEICTGLGSGWHRSPDGPSYRMVETHFPHELGSFLGSVQNGRDGGLDMQWPDRGYGVVLVLSLIGAGWLLLRGRHGEPRVFILFAVVAIIVAAWVCATLSVVDARYLARDSWLLPFAAILAMAERMDRSEIRS